MPLYRNSSLHAMNGNRQHRTSILPTPGWDTLLKSARKMNQRIRKHFLSNHHVILHTRVFRYSEVASFEFRAGRKGNSAPDNWGRNLGMTREKKKASSTQNEKTPKRSITPILSHCKGCTFNEPCLYRGNGAIIILLCFYDVYITAVAGTWA